MQYFDQHAAVQDSIMPPGTSASAVASTSSELPFPGGSRLSSAPTHLLPVETPESCEIKSTTYCRTKSADSILPYDGDYGCRYASQNAHVDELEKVQKVLLYDTNWRWHKYHFFPNVDYCTFANRHS